MYNKTTWKTGDVITQDKLNNIEDGIVSNDTNKVDRLQASIASSPSSTFQDITPGVSGSKFDAPYNGMILIKVQATSSDSWTNLDNITTADGQTMFARNAGNNISASVRCSLGDQIAYYYNNANIVSVRCVANNGDVQDVLFRKR